MSLNDEQRELLSGTATWASGDSGSTKDLITPDTEKRIRPTDYVISYDGSGSNETDVEIHDDASGTASGDLSDSNRIDHFQLSAGDFEVITDVVRRQVQESLVAISQNNNADLTVTVGARRVA